MFVCVFKKSAQETNDFWLLQSNMPHACAHAANVGICNVYSGAVSSYICSLVSNLFANLFANPFAIYIFSICQLNF